jgi:hypothetical protein
VDLVWICRKGENEELRYSIRSATQNLEHDNVWVVGGKPDWYRGKSINVPQRNGMKYENAKNNLRNIIANEKISNQFILMNDDFFTLKKVELKPYFSGTLQQRLDRNERLSPNALYTSKIQTTMDKLQALGFENPLDYSIHIPMAMDKQGLEQALDFPLIRAAYGNLRQVGGEQRSDVKIYSGAIYNGMSFKPNKDSDFISTDDGSFTSIRDRYLHDLFPNPTVYEVTA